MGKMFECMSEHAGAVKILERIHGILSCDPGQAFFDGAVTTVAELLGVPCVLLGRYEGDARTLQVLSWYRGGLIEHNGTLSIQGTPIERILDEGRPYACDRNAWRLFPQDEALRTWRAECYLGVPLKDRVSGEVVGIVAVYAAEPREFTQTERALLELVGSCLAKELERSRREAIIQQLHRKLRHAQKMEALGALTAGIAHDFNNLLTGILGFTELMLMQLESEHGDRDEIVPHLHQVLTLSQRARDLVRQLLLLGRPEESAERMCALHALVKDFAAFLRRLIPESIQIELDLAPEAITVEANPTHVQQVLLNLVLNARDAMPQGGRLCIRTERVRPEAFRIPIRTRVQHRPYVRLSVSDTGTGIAPGVLSRIFDPFFTTKGTGTGLGLSIVREIVHSYGGWIEVESEPGYGTSFHIFWPLAEEPTARVGAEAEEPMPAGGGETLLLVEDDPTILKLGQSLLERLGYRVVIARDGREAIEVYARHREEVRLVLLDVVLPEISGAHVLEELRRINPQVRILAMTGYGSKDQLKDFPWEATDGWLLKPYDLRSLAHALRRCLDKEKEPPHCR
ncbi:Sensor kinase CckA [bacterium HR08]|nr:Sensor kinase CckA [bacterium HR08]